MNDNGIDDSGGNDNGTDDSGVNDNGGGDVSAPETLGGAVNVVDFTIPAGHTTRVTSDLTLTASGNVLIEGSLIADASESVGYGITIDAQGDIDVGGVVQASDGASASEAKRKPTGFLTAQADNDNAPATAELAGKCGGSVWLKSAHRLTIRQSATLQTGNGSDAQDGFPNAHGGCGGSLLLQAGITLTLRGSLVIGNGGMGGLAMTTADDLPSDGFFNNDGGWSGMPSFIAPTLDIPGLRTVRNKVHALDPVEYASRTGSTILGGVGGGSAGAIVTEDPNDLPSFAGVAFVADAAPPQAPPVHSQAGDNGEGAECPAGFRCLTAGSGGWGWLAGGLGGTINVTIGFQRNGLDGTSWSGRAGDGGGVDEALFFDIPDRDVVILDGAQGGPGGHAAVGVPMGWLGDASHPNGGNGGHADATAGNGGNGSLYGQQTGGKGGDALARAGIGGDGFDDPDACWPGAGGNGGDGYAYGGNGGDGTTPGEWGSALAIDGDGGSGGDGSPQAGGGLGGLLYSEGGCLGADNPNATVQPCGLLDEHRAPAGEPGSDSNCCGC